jgi:hypothetical protein
MARNTKAPSIVAQMQEAPAPMQKASALPLSDTVEGQAPRKGRAIKPQASAAASALKLSDIEREVIAAAREGFRSERAGMARDIAALQAAAKDGKACKTFADLYKAATVAELLGFEDNDLGVIRAQGLMQRGAKRDAGQKAAILAANARLSRRVKAAGLEAADKRGAKRILQGKTKAPKAAPAPAKGEGAKAPTQTVMIAPKGMTPPTLVTEADWVDHLHGLAAYLRTAQKKNAKAATHRVREVIAAFLKADAALKD